MTMTTQPTVVYQRKQSGFIMTVTKDETQWTPIYCATLTEPNGRKHINDGWRDYGAAQRKVHRMWIEER